LIAQLETLVKLGVRGVIVHLATIACLLKLGSLHQGKRMHRASSGGLAVKLQGCKEDVFKVSEEAREERKAGIGRRDNGKCKERALDHPDL